MAEGAAQDVAYYQKLAALDPRDAEAHFGLAVALEENGRVAEAFHEFDTALHLSPRHAPANLHKGLLCARVGRRGQALKLWETAWEADPNLAAMWTDPEHAPWYEVKRQQALEAFVRVAASEPDDADSHLQLGLAYKLLDLPDQALQSLKRARILNPHLGEAYLAASQVHASLGRWSDAVLQLSRAADVNPDDSRVQYQLGVLYQRLDEPGHAMSHLERAVELEPNLREAFYELGVLCLDSGDVVRAADAFRRCLASTLDLDPPEADAQDTSLLPQDIQSLLHLARLHVRARGSPESKSQERGRQKGGIPSASRTPSVGNKTHEPTAVARKQAHAPPAAPRLEKPAAGAVGHETARPVVPGGESGSTHPARSAVRPAQGVTAPRSVAPPVSGLVEPSPRVSGLVEPSPRVSGEVGASPHINEGGSGEVEAPPRVREADAAATSAAEADESARRAHDQKGVGLPNQGAGESTQAAGEAPSVQAAQSEAVTALPPADVEAGQAAVIETAVPQPVDSIASLQAALKENPADIGAGAKLARAYMAAGKHALAVVQYQKVLRMEERTDLLLEMGEACERLGMADAALRAYGAAADKDPQSLDVAQRLLPWAMQRRDWRQALQLVQLILSGALLTDVQRSQMETNLHTILVNLGQVPASQAPPREGAVKAAERPEPTSKAPDTPAAIATTSRAPDTAATATTSRTPGAPETPDMSAAAPATSKTPDTATASVTSSTDSRAVAEGAGRVLLAEDDPFLRKMAAEVLKRGGYSVTTADNGEEALELAQQLIPDVVVLDVNMPRLDGFAVARAMKRGATTQRIPVVFLTARSSQTDLLLGYEAGASMYVTKPFDNRHLLRVIGEAVLGGRAR